ncbi:MAG: hypothetical protein FJY82_13310, partial [Candidatus Aminicenantes bacterium]|nr:hypothetical protein [Candidatus Aminicenantes bacterium]
RGWSSGGIMAYWAAAHTDRFKAISAGAGLTNLVSFYGTNEAEGRGGDSPLPPSSASPLIPIRGRTGIREYPGSRVR